MPFRLELLRKIYRADAVTNIAKSAYNDGYDDAKHEYETKAKADLEALRRSFDRERLRLQVAHSLIKAMRTIIDP